MKRDEILALPAGPEMDWQIAVRVFGWKVVTEWQWQGRNDKHPHLVSPKKGLAAWRVDNGAVVKHIWTNDMDFSTEIVDAWRVAEELLRRWRMVLMGDGTLWQCKIYADHNWHELRESATAESAPLAICRAALLAVTDEGSR